MANQRNIEVDKFLYEMRHPLADVIDRLRVAILATEVELRENIKWNAPNYQFLDQDRLTMKLRPPRRLQLIFHRGAKVLRQPAERLIPDPFGLLDWRENDRALASFATVDEVANNERNLRALITAWVLAAR